MFDTQTQFNFVVAPQVEPQAYVPVDDYDLFRYKLYRSNAIFFAGQDDGYSLSNTHRTIVVEKGACVKFSREWYKKCVELWKLASVQDAVRSLTGTDATLSVHDAVSKHETDCLCPKCLAVELKRLVALRKDGAEMIFESGDE